MKIFISFYESTRKTYKNTIDVFLICCLATEISAFDDGGKMAPKMVHLIVNETLAERGQNILHLQVSISVSKL